MNTVTLANSPLVGRFSKVSECWSAESTDGMTQAHVWSARDGGPLGMDPSLWWGAEIRTDNAGKAWRRSLVLVHDDFGNLVELAA